MGQHHSQFLLFLFQLTNLVLHRSYLSFDWGLTLSLVDINCRLFVSALSIILYDSDFDNCLIDIVDISISFPTVDLLHIISFFDKVAISR